MLVNSHLHAAPELAAGVASLPDGGTAFAATQAAWRFLNNERVALPALAEPLRAAGCERAQGSAAPFVLLVHDWCKLTFKTAKGDAVQLTHGNDVGYDLTTALLVSAEDGSPLAPMEMHLRTAQGVLSTRAPAPKHQHHLDQLLPTMNASQRWGVGKPIVHVVDREADSVDRYREWNKLDHRFLVRGDDRRVRWEEREVLLSDVAKQLKQRRRFSSHGTASYRGKRAQLWVAEAQVVLHRAAKKSEGGKKFTKPGKPISLRLIVVQIRNNAGKILAQWLLLSNVPAAWAAAELLARCYYWRWRIENFFKLLKSHGQQVEHWQQRTGTAIARRLLVAAMACVVVWQLQADDSDEAHELKDVLVRLSGRQTKRTRPHTAPALLAGLWVLLSALALLDHFDLPRLKTLLHLVPLSDTG